MDRLFRLPLSHLAVAQLEEIQTSMDSRQWDENVNDLWSYTWGSQGIAAKRPIK